MVDLGCDYSDARPGGARLKAAGVAAVGRYLANDSRGITAAEFADLTAHGIGVWLVRESQTVDLSVSMLNGYAKGASEAWAALALIAQVGLPNLPVFWAADFDIAPGSPRIAQAEAYVDGWNTVIPAGRRGGYGGLWFLNYLHTRGKVEILWECASTSFRHGVSPSQVPLHIQQTTLTPPAPGTDHNYIYDLATVTGSGVPITILEALENEMRLITSTGKLLPILAGPLGCIDVVDQIEIDSCKVAFGTEQFNDVQVVALQRAVGRYVDNAKLVLAGAPTAAPSVDVKALAAALVAALPQGQSATAAEIAAELVKHIS